MADNIAISPGQPFNIKLNKVRSSVSGSWTSVASETADRGTLIHGVYWSCDISGSTLYIRDRDEDVWYSYICNGGTPAIDLFTLSLPLLTKFEYFDSVGSNTIIIYGVYI